MRFEVLGPFQARRDPQSPPLPLGGPKQRTLLAVLVAAGGRSVSTGQLIDELWTGDPPEKATASIQSYVANLRRIIEPESTARTATILLSRPPGYLVDLRSAGADSVDAIEFRRLCDEGIDRAEQDPAAAYELLTSAEALWRGSAYADAAGGVPSLAAEAVRLAELRLLTVETRIRCALTLGEHRRQIAELESLVAANPLRESLYGLLALALYRSDRQADALAAVARARQVLNDELGLDAGPELRRLEVDLLRQEPRLAAPGARPKAPAESASNRIVGRDTELRLAQEVLDAARRGRGRVIVINGEPGIGKTALAAAIGAAADGRGFHTGWGRCSESGDLAGLLPMGMAVGDLISGLPAQQGAEVRERHAGLLARLLPGPDTTAVTVDADTATFRLTRACAALLGEIGPSVVTVDDVQWADEPTGALIRALLPQLARLPVVLVLTVRSTPADVGDLMAAVLADVARNDPVRFRLSGLDLDGARDLAALRRLDLAPEVLRSLHQRSDGNPFFLSELLTLVTSVGGRTAQVPDGVHDVVRRRLAQLPESASAVLQTAALIGLHFDAELAEQASGDPDAADGSDSALHAGLLVTVGEGRLAFAHALVRQAIAERIAPGRRRRLHGAVAASLQGRPGSRDHAAIARHLSAAGREHAAATVEHAMRGAEQASRMGNAELAGQLYDLAVDGGRIADVPLATRLSALVGLAVARKRTGHDHEAWQASLAAAELGWQGGDVIGAAEAIIAVGSNPLWSWREYQTVDVAAVALIRRILTALPPGHARLEGLLRATWAMEVYYDASQDAEAFAESDRAVQLITRDGTTEDLTRVLQLRHMALERPRWLPERLSVAQRLVELAIAQGDETALAIALVFRGRDRIESGDVAGRADYQRARSLATSLSLAPVLVALTWWDVSALVAAGRFDEADVALAQAMSLHGRTSLPGAEGIPMLIRATFDLARRSLAASVDQYQRMAQYTGLGILFDLWALALADRGDRAAAAAMVSGSMADQPDPDYLWLARQVIRARLWSAVADTSAVESLAAALEPYAGRVAIGGTGISLFGAVDASLAMLHDRLGHDQLAAEYARAGRDLNQAMDVTSF